MSLLGHHLPCHSSRYLSCEGEEAKLAASAGESIRDWLSYHDGRLKAHRGHGSASISALCGLGRPHQVESFTWH